MPYIYGFSLGQYNVACGLVSISQPWPTSVRSLTVCDPGRLDLMTPHMGQHIGPFVINAANLAIWQEIATSQLRHAIGAVKADMRPETAHSHSGATAVASQATRRPSALVRWTRGSVFRAVQLDT